MTTAIEPEPAAKPPVERCDVCKKPSSTHPADGFFEAPRAACEQEHDPHPMVTSSIAMAQRNFGGRKLFRPRGEYCADAAHYVFTEGAQ